MPKRARSTQSIANSYPLASNVRMDQQSVGQQLINSLAHNFDDVRKQQQKVHDNWFFPTSCVSDIDVFYSFRLPGSYEFEVINTDEENPDFTIPTVSGIKDDALYPITLASGNNIEGWWYDSLPSRLSLETTVSGEYLLVSGWCASLPFDPIPVSGECHIPNHLYITFSGGAPYVDVTEDNYVQRGLVQIEGVTRMGKEVVEEIPFVHDDTLETFHDFKSISKVRAYGMSNRDSCFLKVESARFNHGDYKDPYLLDETPWKEEDQRFWSIVEGEEVGQWCLGHGRYVSPAQDLRLAGYTEKEAFIRQELLDIAGNRIVPLDLIPEPHSDRIWIVDSSTLYCYDTDLPYPNTKVLEGKDYDAWSRIVPDSYYAIKGESLLFLFEWARPIESIIKHRVWVQKPDGTKWTIVGGALGTYVSHSGSWITGEPQTSNIIAPQTHTFDQHGDWIYSLEVVYGDGTTSLDRRIISVLTKRPIYQYDLTSLGIQNIRGVDFDSEYKLWVSTDTGGQHQISFHYDNMIIDFDRKILYFREPYDKIRVVVE